MPSSWIDEKERKLKLSLEARRKEYSCGSKYISLKDINTWRKDLLYKEKLNKPAKKGKGPSINKEDLKKCLRAEFKLQDLDLSEKVSVFVGDITTLEIDAIVNAANNSLLGGGGVDGAIHRAAGKYLFHENSTLNGCENGEAKISCGYNLPAKYVISTVGPRGEHPDVLKEAYSNSLQIMLDNSLRSIAFPCISTGIYGYPNLEACLVALRVARNFLEKHHQEVDRVIFCLFLQVDVDLYNEYLPYFFPMIDKMESTKPEAEDDKSVSAEDKDEVEATEKEDDVNSVVLEDDKKSGNSEQDETSMNLDKEVNSGKTEVDGTRDKSTNPLLQ